MDEIKPGDVVRLKSGGPLMTVEKEESEGLWWVSWFDPVGNCMSIKIYGAALTKLQASDCKPLVQETISPN